jgi:hypothetical protein
MAMIIYIQFGGTRGFTKRCRLSWLPKWVGMVGVAGSQPMSTAVHRSPNKI